ncbi:MAG: cell division protein FtsA, partial [Marinovum sp.]|nr:cell division protein FtsA [Marinovum sp.]
MMDLYQSQRAMRQMRKAALQKGVIAVLDVGSTKIACLVLRFDGTDYDRSSDGVGSLAGQSGFRVLGAATTQSRGVSFGEIDAMRETERAIRTVLQSAQKMANTPVYHVIVSMAGGNPRSYGLAGSVDIGGGQVSEEDVARVLSSCDVPDFGEAREVLHAQPVNFALDNRSGLSDPRGQVGQKMSTDMHMITVDAGAVQN